MATANPSSGPAFQPFWQHAWEDAQPSLQAIKERLSSVPFIPQRKVRVGQLDAELLDQELVTLLKEPIKRSLALVHHAWSANYDLELSLIIQAILYKFSIWDSGATYGAKLQDLTFKRGPKQEGVAYAPSGISRKILLYHAAITVLLPYSHSRIRAHALSQSWPDAPLSDPRRKAWELLDKLERLQYTLSLVGFIAFLWDGRYRSFTDRLLGLKLVPSRRVVARNVNYEFMNRQMVWHAFTEFLLFILPIVNVRVLRRRVARSLSKIQFTSMLSSAIGLNGSPDTKKSPTGPTQTRGKYFALAEDCCAICAENANFTPPSTSSALRFPLPAPPPHHPSDQDSSTSEAAFFSEDQPKFPINVPYITSCDHTYCYHCLADKMMRAADDGEDGWECLRCDAIVVTSDRVQTMFDESYNSDDSNRSYYGEQDLGSSLQSDDFTSSISSA